MGCSEDTLHYVVDLEVRADLIVVEVVFRFTYLLCVVPPIPGLDSVSGDLFHIVDLGLGALYRRLHDVGQEVVYCLGIAGHLVRELVLGEIAVAEDGCLAGAKTQDVQKQGAVVVFVAVVAAGSIGLEHGLAKLTVFGSRHRGRVFADADAELLLERVALGEDVVADFLGLDRKLAIDPFELRLKVFGQADTLALEAVEVFLEDHLLLAGKAALV